MGLLQVPFSRFAEQVASCKLERQLQAVRKYQENHTDVFSLFLSALTNLYYKSPQVYTSLEKMIDNGPSDPSPFNKGRLDGVIRRGKVTK